MVVAPRAIAWVGAAVLLSLCACADFWKFQTLQDDTVAPAPDATMPAGSGEGGPASDSGPDACSMCGASCVDLGSDLQNCGSCGKRCLASQVCQEGLCACTDNQTLCGAGAATACVDTMTDHANCGTCGNTCAAGTACQGGKCVCPGMEMLCGAGANAACAYLTSDHNNCGGCGNTCAVGGSCQGGACACPTGQQACGAGANATCIDPTTDSNNCGGCGTVCPSTQTCASGHCVPCASIGPSGIMCGTPLTCVNTATDHANCGGCGNPCLATEICQGGMCKCPANEALCGSGGAQGCVTLSSDQNNCGKCGTQCTGGMVCTNSACVCPTGYHNCTGTCVPDTSISTSSCGTTCSLCPAPVRGTSSCGGTPPACGQACANAATPTLCNAGANATCVNTTTDPANCGGCGQACSTNKVTESCTGSKCVVSACAVGFADCDKNPATGCEINILTNVANCGGCGRACNMTGGVEGCVNGKCTNPVCSTGMADCDKNPATGCEVNTATDKNNCGACGVVCPTGTNCTGGMCSNCPAGTLQCNGNCAMCPPSPANGTVTCSGTTCIASCPNPSFLHLCGGGASAACVNLQVDNANCGACGTPCSFATQPNKCLQTYACQAGVCAGSNPVSCPAAGDACHIAGSCVPATGMCSNPTPVPNSPPVACTGPNKCDSYACVGGSCTGTNAVTCTASDSCHQAGACMPGTGMCPMPQMPQPDGTSCSGTNKCDTYACASGVCTGTPAVTCMPSDGCHQAGTCDGTTGICTNPPVPASPPKPCNGSNLCMTYACDGNGMCAATGSTGACTPMDTCHSAMCSSSTGMCVNTPLSGVPCDDSDLCTLNDTCQAGTCAGTEMTCMAQDQCHVAGTCTAGACSNPPAMDGIACTGAAPGMTCQGGNCQCPPATPTLCTVNGTATCVDTTSDPNNCGACNMVCGTPDAGGPPSCSSSMCEM